MTKKTSNILINKMNSRKFSSPFSSCAWNTSLFRFIVFQIAEKS